MWRTEESQSDRFSPEIYIPLLAGLTSSAHLGAHRRCGLAQSRLSLAFHLPVMSETQPEPTKDSLGLDIDSLKLDDTTQETPTAQDAADASAPESASDAAKPAEATADEEQQSAAEDEKKQPPRERKKPYVNPERVKTGGPQRVRPGSFGCASAR